MNNLGKKYKLTDETLNHNGIILHRIEALRNFCDVSIGEKGGFVEKEDNLSHFGNSWIYQNAKVYDNARVFGNAKIYSEAEIFGKANVYGNCIINNNTKIYDLAYVHGGMLLGNTKVFENGGKSLTISIATSRGGYTVKDGTVIPEKTTWHTVVCNTAPQQMQDMREQNRRYGMRKMRGVVVGACTPCTL